MKKQTRIRRQKASVRPGQKVLVKIGTNNKRDKNCAEYAVKDDYLLPFGVVGTIKDFIKKREDKKKKVIGYLVELQNPVPEVIEAVGDLFRGEIDKINRFFNDPAVIHNPYLDKYYVSVHKDICCFLL